MGHYSRALREELFKYQKRKQSSLDGSVPGLQPGHWIPGLHYVSPYGSRGGAPGGFPMETYDPGRAFYQSLGTQYRQPPAWFEGMMHRTTPPLRVAPGPGSFARALMPDDLSFDGHSPDAMAENPLAAETPTLFQESMPDQAEALGIPRQMLADVLLLGLEDLGDFAGPMDTTLNGRPDMNTTDPLADHPWYGQAEMTQEMFDQAMAAHAGQGMEPEPMAPEPDPFEAAPTAFAEPGQGLEGLIAQDPFAAQPAPGAMPDPMMPDPYAAQQQMYDDQMQQLMDPWMMPGPFGPGFMGPGFGPMPGP